MSKTLHQTIEEMTNEDLQVTWNALYLGYDPHEYWDAERGITMDIWAMNVLSEVERRGLSTKPDKYRQPEPEEFMSQSTFRGRYGDDDVAKWYRDYYKQK